MALEWVSVLKLEQVLVSEQQPALERVSAVGPLLALELVSDQPLKRKPGARQELERGSPPQGKRDQSSVARC